MYKFYLCMRYLRKRRIAFFAVAAVCLCVAMVLIVISVMDKLGVEITYHRFWLDDSADFRWAGSGAFSRTNLGFVRGTSNGSTDVGQELDILVTYPVNRWLSVLGGYSKLWGGDVFATTPNSDADFAYLQLQVKY